MDRLGDPLGDVQVGIGGNLNKVTRRGKSEMQADPQETGRVELGDVLGCGRGAPEARVKAHPSFWSDSSGKGSRVLLEGPEEVQVQLGELSEEGALIIAS